MKKMIGLVISVVLCMFMCVVGCSIGDGLLCLVELFNYDVVDVLVVLFK